LADENCSAKWEGRQRQRERQRERKRKRERGRKRKQARERGGERERESERGRKIRAPYARLNGGAYGAGCRVQDTGCRVQGAGCRVQGAGCGVQGTGCKVQGAGFRVQGPGSRVSGLTVRAPQRRRSWCRMQGAGCRVQGAGCGVRGAGCRVQGPGPRVSGLTVRAPRRTPCRSRCAPRSGPRALSAEMGKLLPNNRRQRRTCYALCHILYPVSAAHTSIFRMDSNSTSYSLCTLCNHTTCFSMTLGCSLCEDRIHNSEFKVALKRLTATLRSNYGEHNETLRF
jgi:hypothetical protein